MKCAFCTGARVVWTISIHVLGVFERIFCFLVLIPKNRRILLNYSVLNVCFARFEKRRKAESSSRMTRTTECFI